MKSLMAFITLVALLLAGALACFADDTGFGVLQGTVKFTDGRPYVGAQVSVVVNGTPLKKPLLTDDTGSFNAFVPAGDATITVEGVAKKVTITAGAQATVDFSVKQTGVMVTVVFPDETHPENFSLTGAYKSPAGNPQNLQPRDFGAGRYWFNTVPADATAFAVIARQMTGFTPMFLAHQWTFATPADHREITLTLGKSAQVSVLVLDGDGHPVANADVKGSMSFPRDNVSYWGDGQGNTVMNDNNYDLNNRRTDENGMLALGAWPANKYTLSMHVNKMIGKPQPFTVAADGVAVMLKYALDLKPRDVTQTLFTADGKVAPHTPVVATYSWADQWVYAHAVSDANGLVTWSQLPPVRVIVWGDTIPAGVIMPDAVKVTAPLPAVVADQASQFNNNNFRNFTLKLTNIGDQPVSVLYMLKTDGRNFYPQSNEMRYQPAPGAAEQAMTMNQSLNGAGGSTFSLVAAALTTPARLISMVSYYVPFMEQGDNPTLTLALQPGTIVSGKVTCHDQPVSGVSQFRIAALKVSGDISSVIDERMKRRLHLYTPHLAADGTFSTLVPGAGSYRFFVDLYDEQTPAIPELCVDVPAEGKTDVQLKLPAPLLTAMAPGTIVRWLTKNAPCAMKSLTVMATANPMQLFGPREQLLACWFASAPDTMCFFTSKDTAIHKFTLRSVDIEVVNPQPQQQFAMDWTMTPWLPINTFNNYQDQSLIIKSDRMPTIIAADASEPTALWPGKYLLSNGNSGIGSLFTLVDIPQTGPQHISVTAPAPRMQQDQMQRMLQVTGTHTANNGNDNNNMNILVRFDEGDWDNNQYLNSWNLRNGNFNLRVPQTARTFTLYWPGVGYVKNVAIPKGNDNANITLPAWDNGMPLSGTILQPDGQPYASKAFTVIPVTSNDNGNGNSALRGTTDAHGAFTVNGLIPGPVCLSLQNNNGWNNGQPEGGWMLTIPDGGAKDLTLHMSTNPTHIPISRRNGPMNGGGTQNLWIPDNGAPMHLLATRYNNECILYDFPGGPGYLWNYSASGDGDGQHVMLAPGANAAVNQPMNGGYAPPIGNPLGLYFPLDLAKGLPGKIELIGLENRAAVHATFSMPIWRPSAMLDKVVTQINAVPPGKYRVIVSTDNGPAETQVTITDFGATAEFTYPAAPAPIAVPVAAPAAPAMEAN